MNGSLEFAVRDLARSGLDAWKYIKSEIIVPLSRDRLRELAACEVGLSENSSLLTYPAYLIRYPNTKGYWRIRLDVPRDFDLKYLGPKGRIGIFSLHDEKTFEQKLKERCRVHIVEGEKKAMALAERLPKEDLVIGIGGVWNWCVDHEPFPIFDSIPVSEVTPELKKLLEGERKALSLLQKSRYWGNREVIIWPDAEWQRNRSDIIHPIVRLGLILAERTARVFVRAWGERHKGIDDALVAGVRIEDMELLSLTDFMARVSWMGNPLIQEIAARELPEPVSWKIIQTLAKAWEVDPEKLEKRIKEHRRALARKRANQKRAEASSDQPEDEKEPEENAPPVKLPSLRWILRWTSAFIRRFVVLDERYADLLALWVAHTWTYDVFRVTPYLAIISPEQESGKTTLLEVLEQLTYNGNMSASNMTEAALFRTIAEEPVTLLIDELDEALRSNSDRAKALKIILDVGYNRKGAVPRCVEDGKREFRVKKFNVFCPKAFTAIGEIARFSKPLASRCLTIRMRRGDPPRDFDLDDPDIQRRISKFQSWMRAYREQAPERLREALLEIVKTRFRFPGLSPRENQILRPLLCNAKLAGEEWVKRLEDAIPLLTHGRQQVQSKAGYLLGAIDEIFHQQGAKSLSSEAIYRALVERAESDPELDVSLEYLRDLDPTDKTKRRGALVLVGKWLASRLKKYNIKPRRTRDRYEWAHEDIHAAVSIWARPTPRREYLGQAYSEDAAQGERLNLNMPEEGQAAQEGEQKVDLPHLPCIFRASSAGVSPSNARGYVGASEDAEDTEDRRYISHEPNVQPLPPGATWIHSPSTKTSSVSSVSSVWQLSHWEISGLATEDYLQQYLPYLPSQYPTQSALDLCPLCSRRHAEDVGCWEVDSNLNLSKGGTDPVCPECGLRHSEDADCLGAVVGQTVSGQAAQSGCSNLNVLEGGRSPGVEQEAALGHPASAQAASQSVSRGAPILTPNGALRKSECSNLNAARSTEATRLEFEHLGQLIPRPPGKKFHCPDCAQGMRLLDDPDRDVWYCRSCHAAFEPVDHIWWRRVKVAFDQGVP